MSRRFVLVVVVALMFGSMAIAVDAQPTRTRDSPGRPTDGQGGPDDANSSRQESRRPGRLNVTDDSVAGRYISFNLDLPTCTVSAFQAYGTTMFEEIRLPGRSCRIIGGGSAGRMEIRSADAYLRVHDAPNALLQFQARNGTVAADLASSATISSDDDGFVVTLRNLTGRIFTRNDTMVNLTASTLSGQEASFMLHPASGASAERREIFDAIQRGKVGAETDILFENGALVNEVLTYDDVRLGMHRKEKDRFDFTVEGDLPEGRVFITNFAPGAWDPERLRVDYADVDAEGRTHPVLIRQADRLEDVLDFDPGKGPVYFAFEDEDGWHAAVAVPEFSVHVFQVVGLPLQVVPLLLYGVVIGGLFLAAGGLGILMERRQRA